MRLLRQAATDSASIARQLDDLGNRFKLSAV